MLIYSTLLTKIYLRHYMDYFTWAKTHSLLGGISLANYLGDSENLIVYDSDAIWSSSKNEATPPQTPPHIHRRINTNIFRSPSWYFSEEWNRVCFYVRLNVRALFWRVGVEIPFLLFWCNIFGSSGTGICCGGGCQNLSFTKIKKMYWLWPHVFPVPLPDVIKLV